MKLTEAKKRYSIAMALVFVAGSLMLVVPSADAQVTPAPICTAVNALGFAYSGLVCGGSVLDNCTPGALYQCSGGFPNSNCTFAQVCSVGCLTGPTSTSVSLNTSAPTAADACFIGPPPLTLSTNSTLGGNDVTLTATLTEPHSPFGAFIEMLNLTFADSLLVPSLCGGGQLAPDATTLSFNRPTAVVSAPTDVPLSLLIGYTPDPTTGKGRTLVSTPTVLTLNPGGVELPSTVSSFTLTPSTIPPGQGSSIALTMTRASTTPNQITLTSSNPSVASGPGPKVDPGSITASSVIFSAPFVPDTTTVTIGASAQGQVPVTNLLTVTATPLALGGRGAGFNPASVVSGGSSVGTFTLNKPAPAGGIQGFLSAPPGVLTGASLLNLPPSITIPEGQTSASFTATAPPLTAPDDLGVLGDFPALGQKGGGFLRVSPVETVLSLTFKPDGMSGIEITTGQPVPVGGDSLTGTVTLYAPAPVGGAVVTLSNIWEAFTPVVPNPITLPASVTVPAGATSASFTFTVNHVSVRTGTTITAALNGFSTNAFFTVYPILRTIDFGFDTWAGGTSKTAAAVLLAPAPPGGALVTLTSSDPALVSVPPSVTVPAGAKLGTFIVNTGIVTAFTFATVSASYDGATVSMRLFVKPPAVSWVGLTPNIVVSGNASTGTVTLDVEAGAAGAVVTLSSNSGLATVPPSVAVPAFAKSATFPVNTSPVGATTFVIITATLGVSSSAGLTLTPAPLPPPGPVLSTVSLSPTSVVGGASSTGTVTLSAPAPTGGGSVSLSCNSTAATVPLSVTVPAGATSATFTVTTTSVTTSTSAIITTGYGGVSKSATLTVNPGAPAAPSLISPALDATPAQPVTFDWSDVAGATSYEIQVDDSQTIAAPFIASQIVSVSQATIGGLPAKRLWWRVRAQNSAGDFGPFSATRRFTPQAAPAAASLSTLSLSPASVVGGVSSTGTVTLTAAAPTGGAVVTLTSSNAAVTTPASVTVAAGSTSAGFTVTTTAVTVSTSVTITASFGGVSKTALLTVSPPGAPPPLTISGLALNPTSVVGGNSSVATVTLSAVAPTGGAVVTLSSNNTAVAKVPLSGSVTVAAGATSATFTVTTVSVTVSTSATISASFGGVTKTALLTVTPPAPPPSASATLTVTATGRTGERVSSSPAGISVAVGSTGSAAFATGTSITLSVSNTRDAIWSGTCSSGGARAKTCTFTLTANASVTANVQ